MPQVRVVATLVARKGCDQELEKLLKGLVAQSRKDEGCVQYDLHRGIDEPRVYVFYEIWESMELLQKHSKTPHLDALQRDGAEVIESSDIKVLERIA